MQHRWSACLLLASIEVSPTIAFSAHPRSRVVSPASSHDATTAAHKFGNHHGWIGRRPRLDLRSYEGGDFPSDVGDGDTASPAAVLADDNPELRETVKREILSIAATSNRCAYACVRAFF